jgi:hypothetical protein
MYSMATDTFKEFRSEIFEFLLRTGMKHSKFGILAINDGNFVGDLRRGKRSPTLRTIERVRKFMASHEVGP